MKKRWVIMRKEGEYYAMEDPHDPNIEDDIEKQGFEIVANISSDKAKEAIEYVKALLE